MLNVPRLDDLSYDVIFERARARVPALTGEWTDLNHHDPGITTLQAFAWLADTLQYYMNATGEEHRLKYLKLLGIRPEKAAATAHLAIRGKGRAALGRGCRFLAQDTVFELTESVDTALNGLKALWGEVDGKFTDLTPFAGVDGGTAQVFTNSAEAAAALYFGFENPMGATIRPQGAGSAVKDIVRFYVEVAPVPQRNPIGDGPGEGVKLAEIEWDYYAGEGWHGATLVADGTCGFLRSGFIELDFPGRTTLLLGHKKLPEAFYLRARLVKNEYDVLPRLGAVLCNSVPVRQTATLAEALEVPYEGGNSLTLDYHVGAGQKLWVALRQDDGYALWYDPDRPDDALCEVRPGGQDWQRVVVFDQKRFGAAPAPGQTVLAVVADGEFAQRTEIGTTNGTAGQRLDLDIDDLYDLRLALVSKREGRPFLRLWDEWRGAELPADDARVFTLRDGGAALAFGDGTAGLQPEAGQRVFVAAARTSLLEGGNVLKNQINAFAGPAPEGLRVYNPQAAAGGKRPKTSHQLEEAIGAKLAEVSRAVSAEDYVRIVAGTPGLIIEGVAVISAEDYAAFYPRRAPEYGNTVLVAVKPRDSRTPRPQLSAAYARQIERHMEGYRLVTTQVKIIPARYAGIEVYGRITLADNTPAARKLVLQRLEELVDTARTGVFGAPVVYGRLFSHLEMLEEVRAVAQLSLACIGDGARKTEQGDVLVAPDTMTWLAGTDIEFS